MTLGATYRGDGRCEITVWAPHARRVEVRLAEQLARLEPGERGYHSAVVDGLRPGDRYAFVLDGRADRPDPASRHQPDGVHRPSAVVDPGSFEWGDGSFVAPSLRELVIYELHVGTFTHDGTFDAATTHFRALRELGITALEPLPIAQFPGARNWGYDGVYGWAPQASYGGPDGFRRFVDAAHREGLAVILDVVYNHVGPEGNYFAEFGPYFTDRYRTPWGQAVNFDGPHSDEVRRYFTENALMWLREYHVDGFRLDAVHAIVDRSARLFLAELSDAVHAEAARLGRAGHLIAESDQNDVRVITPSAARGQGFDATWSDDFHHSIHALLTAERTGYYLDFGSVEHLAETLRRGWAYAGQYSQFRKRRHGNDPQGAPPERFVVAIQDHDQVGNRARGDRLSTLVGFEPLKLAAAALLLSPFTPTLFMGEEYGERRPFLFFTSHADHDLIRSVREGRREEFKEFAWQGEVPDPQSEDTYRASVLDRDAGDERVRSLYRELLRLRRETPALLDGAPTAVTVHEQVIAIERERSCVLLNFGPARALPFAERGWRRTLDTADPRFGGPGSGNGLGAESAVLLERG